MKKEKIDNSQATVIITAYQYDQYYIIVFLGFTHLLIPICHFLCSNIFHGTTLGFFMGAGWLGGFYSVCRVPHAIVFLAQRIRTLSCCMSKLITERMIKTCVFILYSTDNEV